MHYAKIEIDSKQVVVVINTLRKRAEVLINTAVQTNSQKKSEACITLASELTKLANELVNASNFPEYVGSKIALDHVIYGH